VTLIRSHMKVSHHQKAYFLQNLNEVDLIDKALLPLLSRMGFRKPAISAPPYARTELQLVGHGPLKDAHVYQVQVVRGKLSLSISAKEKLDSLTEKLKRVLGSETSRDHVASIVLLCVIGEVNARAKEHLSTHVSAHRLIIWDLRALVAQIDLFFPELWHGIDENTFPYLKALRESLLQSPDYIGVSGLTGAPITDDAFIPVYLNRVNAKLVKKNGQSELEPDIVELSATNMLNRPERQVLILGSPGSGKTTLLRRMAYKLIEDAVYEGGASKVPIIVRAQDIAKSEGTLRDLIEEKVSSVLGCEVKCESFEDFEDRVAVLIDALDEVSNVDRPAVARSITEYLIDFPACRLIATSRDYLAIAEDQTFAKFYHYRISDLSLKDAAKIVDRASKGKSVSAHSAKEVLRQLQDVHGLRLSPLLVTVFVAGSDFESHDIPANITEVFKKYAEMMLGRWDQMKGFKSQHESIEKDFLLKRLAFKMHVLNATRISKSDFEEIIYQELLLLDRPQDAASICDELLFKTGLLYVEGNDLGFTHHLMQEFFAGRAVTDVEFFKTVISDEWWRAPILFSFGDKPDECRSLIDLAKCAKGADVSGSFEAAITVGLASQACYLSPTVERSEVMSWVVETLATSMLSSDKSNVINEKYPLSNFVYQYLHGRDAVAGDVIGNVAAQKLWKLHLEGSESKYELQLFWLIVGLVEAGELVKAEIEIDCFEPEDRRLLLALELGCLLIGHLRMVPYEQKRHALRLAEKIGNRVPELRSQIFSEYRSHLLEIRQKQVSAVHPEQIDLDQN
jgi:hypothetical protein